MSAEYRNERERGVFFSAAVGVTERVTGLFFEKQIAWN